MISSHYQEDGEQKEGGVIISDCQEDGQWNQSGEISWISEISNIIQADGAVSMSKTSESENDEE